MWYFPVVPLIPWLKNKVCEKSVYFTTNTTILCLHINCWGFPGGSVVKNLLANAGDSRDTGSIPEWGRSPVRGNGYPLQYSCLKNPMDRGAGWTTVLGVAESDRTEQLTLSLSFIIHTHTHTHTHTPWHGMCDLLILVPSSGVQRCLLQWKRVILITGSNPPLSLDRMIRRP